MPRCHVSGCQVDEPSHDELEVHLVSHEPASNLLQHAEDYVRLRQVLIAGLNPRDDDAAEISILTDALEEAIAFVAAHPCWCTPGMIEDWSACRRCEVLGRLGDKPVDR